MRCRRPAEPLPGSLSPQAQFRLLSAAAQARKSKLYGTRARSRLTGCAVRHTGNVCHQPWGAKPTGVAVNTVWINTGTYGVISFATSGSAPGPGVSDKRKAARGAVSIQAQHQAELGTTISGGGGGMSREIARAEPARRDLHPRAAATPNRQMPAPHDSQPRARTCRFWAV